MCTTGKPSASRAADGPLRLLDERVPRPADRASSGDSGAGDWLRIGEELLRDHNAQAQARALALMVEGRVSYSPSPRTS